MSKGTATLSSTRPPSQEYSLLPTPRIEPEEKKQTQEKSGSVLHPGSLELSLPPWLPRRTQELRNGGSKSSGQVIRPADQALLTGIGF